MRANVSETNASDVPVSLQYRRSGERVSHFHAALLMKPYAVSISVLGGAKTGKGSMHEMTRCTQRQKKV